MWQLTLSAVVLLTTRAGLQATTAQMVIQKADVVTDLELESDVTFIRASWQVQNISNDFDNCQVMWSRNGSYEEECKVMSPSTSTDDCESAPNGLSPCTLYKVTIQPRNSLYEPIGSSATDSTYTMSTATDIIPTCTRSGGGVNNDPPQLSVSWNDPQRCTLYTVSWVGTVLWDSTMDPVTGQQTTRDSGVEIRAAVPHTAYHVTVSWTDGRGDHSQGCNVTTPETKASAPTSLVASATANTITVSWLPPAAMNGVWKSYQVEWWSETIHDKPMGTTELSFLIPRLSECTTYSISVLAVTGAGDGNSTLVQSNTLGDEIPPVTAIHTVNISSSSIGLSWTRPATTCAVTSYVIDYTGVAKWGDPPPVHSGATDVNTTDADTYVTVVISDLQAYTSYAFTVKGANAAGEGDEAVYHEDTDEDVPGPPQNLVLTAVNNTIRVTWQPPALINGNFINYKIIWTKNSSIENSYNQDYNTSHYYTIDAVAECASYNVTVAANTGAGEGEPAREQMFSGVPPSVAGFSCNNSTSSTVTLSWTKPTTQCDINTFVIKYEGAAMWENSLPPHVGSNTFPNTYVLGVIDDLQAYTAYTFSMSAETEAGPGDGVICKAKTKEGPPSAPQELKLLHSTLTSLTVEWQVPEMINAHHITKYLLRWTRINSANHSQEVYVVDLYNSHVNYTIEKLDSLENYNVSVQAETIAFGPETSQVFKTVESKGVTTGVIIGAVVGSIALVLVVVAVVKRESIGKWMMEQKGLSTQGGSSAEVPGGMSRGGTEQRPHGGLGSHPPGGQDHSKLLLDKITHEIVVLQQPGRLQDIFSRLVTTSAAGTTTAAQLPCNKALNRYMNILPYDATRVKLSRDGRSDYINASHIKFPAQEGTRLIVTQGPLDATVVDFWHMLWEQQVTTVVMLAQCSEGGKHKCAQYWPRLVGESLSRPPFVVTLEEEQQGDGGVTRRRLVVTLGVQRRTVQQLHLPLRLPGASPSPTPEAALLSLLQQTRRAVRAAPSGTTVVHCSAGAGRSGTFVGLWLLQVEVEGRRGVAVSEVVAAMEADRRRLLQTKDQYLYLYQCLAKYLEDPARWSVLQHAAVPNNYGLVNNSSGGPADNPAYAEVEDTKVVQDPVLHRYPPPPQRPIPPVPVSDQPPIYSETHVVDRSLPPPSFSPQNLNQNVPLDSFLDPPPPPPPLHFGRPTPGPKVGPKAGPIVPPRPPFSAPGPTLPPRNFGTRT